MTTTAILFDIDGTLVDSNFLHVDAWARTFADLGLSVESWRIQRAIGADSSELLNLLIPDAPEETRDRAKELHTEHYGKLMPRLALLDDARELVAAIDAHGVRVVLATSAPQEELEVLQKVLNIDDTTYAVTSAEDVETAKPRPDIIEVALDKAGVAASDAFMVGDSTWDIAAARKAGVPAIGVTSGGTSEHELFEEGAVAVYDDVAQLLRELEGSPLARLW